MKQCIGTLGAWSYDRPYYVTAGHYDAYDSIIDEVADALYKDPTDTGWELIREERFNPPGPRHSDSTRVKIRDPDYYGITYEIVNGLNVIGVMDPYIGMEVCKYGRTTEETCGTVVGTG